MKKHIDLLDLDSGDRRVRLLALLSAVIAVGNEKLTEEAIRQLDAHEVNRTAINETILQSYLFLGFPRMIDASLAYNRVYGDQSDDSDISRFTDEESKKWYTEGKALCRRVYGKNYDRLKKRFMAMSPEVFRWMVLEGYGKVLNRPGLSHIERELAEVAALIVDRRERQLVSHVRGSLNVGASIELIKKVNTDIKPLAGNEASEMADCIISEIEKKYAPDK
jgi:alkylhydroperoxidase/carboxymuconolactone decarboxylase family protein YurZ